MELGEAQDNLRAMRLLYRLLEDNSLGLQNTNSEGLVERARELLKNMLEMASERVFETILKIIATEAGISKTPSTSQPVSLNLRPLFADNRSHCSVKYPTRCTFSSRKSEKLPAKKAAPGLSKCGISDKGKAVRKTNCSVGEESSIMQENLVKEANLSYEKPILPIKGSSHHEEQHSMSTFHIGEHSKESLEMFESKAGELKEASETPLLYRDCEIESSPNASSWVEPQHEEGDISNDLINAIKRIESRILALQLCSSLVYSKKNVAGDTSMHKVTNSDSPLVEKTEGIAGNRSSYGKSLLEGNASMNQQTNQLAHKCENLTTANAFVEPNEPLSKVENQIHLSESLVDPAMGNGITTQRRSQKGQVCRATGFVSRREKLLSQNGFRPQAQRMAMKDRLQSLNQSVSGNDHLVSQANECIQGLRIPLNSITTGPTAKDKPIRRNPAAQSETHRKEKQLLHQMVLRPPLLDQRSTEIKMPPHRYKDRIVLENRGTHKMRPSLPHHHDYESEEFSSSSGTPSRWTSDQSSAIYSSESEDTGDSPGRTVSMTYADSSRECSDPHSQNDDGSSDRGESFSSSRSRHRRDPEKTMGRLRRLKNKLGLIFHHHHHLHHHHHHDEDDGKISKDHRHSMWQRIFHGKNKHKLLAKRKAGKTREGTVAKLPHGNQGGQFHGLVEGLLRHIRHSKKRKPSKVGKGSRNPKRANRKKLHWWQMLRRHRRVRLNNGGRLKVGFKSQKSLKN